MHEDFDRLQCALKHILGSLKLDHVVNGVACNVQTQS